MQIHSFIAGNAPRSGGYEGISPWLSSLALGRVCFVHLAVRTVLESVFGASASASASTKGDYTSIVLVLFADFQVLIFVAGGSSSRTPNDAARSAKQRWTVATACD